MLESSGNYVTINILIKMASRNVFKNVWDLFLLSNLCVTGHGIKDGRSVVKEDK